MKVKSAIERGASYFYVKIGAIVTAIGQLAVVKGLPMWEVELTRGSGVIRRYIVPASALKPAPLSA